MIELTVSSLLFFIVLIIQTKIDVLDIFLEVHPVPAGIHRLPDYVLVLNHIPLNLLLDPDD